jgi:hypothetical protein
LRDARTNVSARVGYLGPGNNPGEEVAVHTRHKLVITVLGVILVVLGVMLVIALHQGDDTSTDKNNSNVKGDSIRILTTGP